MSGRLSLLSGEWDQYPRPVSALNEYDVQRKANSLRRMIEYVLEDDDTDHIERSMDRLFALRRQGDMGRAIFRVLHHDGTLQRLREAARREYDQALSYSCNCSRKTIRYSKGDAHQPTVAVDLDGTLAEYDGETDHIGHPKAGARSAMLALRQHGFRIIIWTCRGDTSAVEDWLDKYDIPYDDINHNDRQPDADIYLDDRAIDPTDDLMSAVAEAIDRISGE